MKGIEREAITETERVIYMKCIALGRGTEKETERRRQRERDREIQRQIESAREKEGERKREGNSLGQKRCVGADSFFHGC